MTICKLPRLRQRGSSLIELMVGLAIGLIIVTALLVLFANGSSTGQNLARSSALIENSRYTAELLRDEIALAGFYGEVPQLTTTAVYTDPDPCQTTPTGVANTPFTLPAPIRGVAPGDVLGCLSNRKPGTSAITLRRLATATSAPPGAGGSQYFVQYSFCRSDPQATGLVFDKTGAAFTLRGPGCVAVNAVRAYIPRVYFIASCNRCGAGGDTTPTLKRVELVGGTLIETALAEGVEELRFEYGFDTNGDGNTDAYLNDDVAPAATGPAALWQNVMAVKVHFVIRSLDKVRGGPTTADAAAYRLGNVSSAADPGDGFSRRTVSSTVRLINPSGARETPP